MNEKELYIKTFIEFILKIDPNGSYLDCDKILHRIIDGKIISKPAKQSIDLKWEWT